MGREALVGGAAAPDPRPSAAPAAFRYVEFAARRRPGFRNAVVTLEEVAALVRRYGAFGCYMTFYLFDEGLSRYAEEHRRRGAPSVAGYGGPVVAPTWPLDVDAADLGEALATTRRIHRHLTGAWGVPGAAIRAYFSGKKGFHLLVDTRVFRAPVPSAAMPEALHRLTVRLGRELGLPPSGPLDLGLRDRVRLLRLPNTVHESSRLYKVSLSSSELFGLAPADVRGLARTPRPLGGTDPTGLLWEGPSAASAEAGRIFRDVVAPPRAAGPRRVGLAAAGTEGVLECTARRRLLEEPARVGQRNNVAIRLASWLREAGKGTEEVENLLLAWNRRNAEPLAEGEVAHVVASAFAREAPYHYGCHDPLIEPRCPGPTEHARCPYHRTGGP